MEWLDEHDGRGMVGWLLKRLLGKVSLSPSGSRSKVQMQCDISAVPLTLA